MTCAIIGEEGSFAENVKLYFRKFASSLYPLIQQPCFKPAAKAIDLSPDPDVLCTYDAP
jgi:hypothetical protein